MFDKWEWLQNWLKRRQLFSNAKLKKERNEKVLLELSMINNRYLPLPASNEIKASKKRRMRKKEPILRYLDFLLIVVSLLSLICVYQVVVNHDSASLVRLCTIAIVSFLVIWVLYFERERVRKAKNANA
jgi:Flp pilus assembly protein TadB